MPRLFVGLELPSTLKEAAISACSGYPAPRWQQASQLHLTLRFLGQVSELQMPALQRALENVAAPAFDLAVEGVGCFGRADSPSILWAGVTPSDPLEALRARIDASLRPLALRMDTHAFRPHITVARLHPPAADARSWLELHASLQSPRTSISSFSLISSVPAEDGSRYTALDDYRLAKD